MFGRIQHKIQNIGNIQIQTDKIYNFFMYSKKRGNKRVNKKQRTNSMSEDSNSIDDKPLKCILKGLKKAQKSASTSSRNKFSNNQAESKRQKHQISQEQYEQYQYEDQVQVQDNSLVQIQVQLLDHLNDETISNAFQLLNQKFQKLTDEKQKLSQPLSKKNQEWEKYSIYLEQEKEIYKQWLQEMRKKFDQYYTYLELKFDQIQAQKQITEPKTKIKVKCEQLKNDIIKLKMQQKDLNVQLQRRLRTKIKNEKKEIQTLDNFYDQKLYKSKQTYIEMISNVSEIMMKIKKQENTLSNRDDYANKLKLILYKTGTQYLSQSNEKKLLENYHAWSSFKQIIQEILITKRINFLAFKIQNEEFDLHFRQMLIDSSFVNFRETYKNTKNIERSLINYQPLSQLSIKRSQIYQLDEINQLEQMVQVLKNSWYIKFHLAYYICDRQGVFEQIRRKDKNQKNFRLKSDQEILNSVEKLMKKAKVYFIDYAMVSVNGITLTADPCKQYPIFINLFSFFQSKKISIGQIQSFTLFLLVHELAHSVIRNYDWIQSGESSNPFNFIKNNKKDGGWLFQNLIFGGPIEVYSEKDYQNVKVLLKLQNCPTFIKKQRPINKHIYENHHKKIRMQYEKQMDHKDKFSKNSKDSDYLIKQKKNHQQVKNLQKIQNQKTQLDKKIDQYSKIKPKNENSQVKTKIQAKKESYNDSNIKQKQFKQMEQIISKYGQRKLTSIKSNEKHHFMSLKIGNQIQQENQLRPLNLCCGTHYK